MENSYARKFDALIANNTWDIVPLPDCKWVYKIKHKSDGNIKMCKARLVAKSFNKKEEIDYGETFSPIVRMTTVKCLIIVVIKKN